MNNLPSAEITEPWNQTLVVGIPEIGLLQVTTPDGIPQQASVELPQKQVAARFAAVSAMYLSVGPGEHSLRYVSRRADLSGLAAASEVIRLSNVMPEDVVQYGLSGDGREVVRFGKLAVAGRKPTFDELMLHGERANQLTRPTAERRREETMALDPSKIDLTDFDNVSIRIGERLLHLRLDSPLTFLAARILGKFSHLTREDRRYYIDAGVMARNIWDCMPLAERSVHVEEKDLFGMGVGLEKRVDEVCNTLTSVLGVTRRGSGRRYRVETSDIALRFGQAPPETILPEGVSLLCPPGTNPDIVLGQIPERYISMARAVLPLGQGSGLSQAQALIVVDQNHTTV